LKYTPERTAIVEVISKMKCHFDVDKLSGDLYKSGSNISRASIYRTIPLLVESGLLSKCLRQNGKFCYSYAPEGEHHDHLVCKKCGKIIDFLDDKLEKDNESICKKYGFKHVEHTLKIEGYCSECK